MKEGACVCSAGDDPSVREAKCWPPQIYRCGNWHLTCFVLEFRGSTEKLDKNRCIDAKRTKLITIVMIALDFVQMQQQLQQCQKQQPTQQTRNIVLQ